MAEQLILDYRCADLAPADRALCDFAVRLTRAPGDMGEHHLEPMRAHGLDDESILVAVQVIAYFNGINRIADALRVDPEPWMTGSPEDWRAAKAHDWDADPGP